MNEIGMRGLSYPEPVLTVMDEMGKHPGVELIVLSDVTHTRDNIVKPAKEYGRRTTVAMRGRDTEITIF